jgi:hypothetical protein
MTTSASPIRELDYRSSNGIHVSLLWHPTTRRVTIDVYDESLDESFEFEVARDRARDAFHHPYAYAPATEPCRAATPAKAGDA